ncbi:hypothetical protein FSP39_013435 [Pinctada imbricata]|uniref:non-specific protein-tyrosine kinase n=1 Tax=Pinctada imbricata TaxID=66713 RepID=A0AA89C849_PINIB|nr:hypothetical protein FSP39_013435 [Pinctada imbricata]
MGTVRELHDFLEEAELLHYYSAFCNQLRITTVPQLKYVEEEDLLGIGMTKPEMRRLKKMYKKECPHGALGKLKKAILKGSGEGGTGRTLSPSPPEQRSSRPLSSYMMPGKQIIPSDSIQVNKTLGEGEFGVVQQGIWTTERGDKVTELAPMRSLLECLKEQNLRLDFPVPRLCDFAYQICDGMSYLEGKRLIHRDLAARNILVFSKNKVKISDFGLSRALGVGKDYYQSKYSINLKLPIAWCAPECINYLKFTSASDVWAYWCDAMGNVYIRFPTMGSSQWTTGKSILEAIDTPNCQRLDRPDLCPREYYDLMLKCWYQDPQKRPTFSEIFITLPQVRPTLMKATREFPEVTCPMDHLYYRANDIIVVLDKSPNPCPSPGFWKGVQYNGKSGFFDPTNFMPVIENTNASSPASPVAKITRKESKRTSKKILSVDMISGPQNDLRHTGHIGYDGTTFGDVSFIGDNYNKLPIKVASKSKLNELHSSSISLPRVSPDKESTVSMNGSLGNGHSWISQESIDSTFLTKSDERDCKNTEYTDIDDDSIFADFKMPDLSTSFDFGPSFMDEVLRALSEKEAKLEAHSDSTSTPSQEDANKLGFDDRSRSISPPVAKETKQTPPPLPSQPPRMDGRRDPPRPEPRKQAKVKPMSASDERMMESAIAMANEFVSHGTRSHGMDSQSPPTSPVGDKTRSDSESSADSPKLIQKIKNSIKRSPKIERKRTFSEEIQNKACQEDDVPPGAQEAYNMLVVRGSVKEKASAHEQRYDRHFRENKGLNDSFERDFRQDRESPLRQDRQSPFRQDSRSGRRESPARTVPLANTSEVFLDMQLDDKPVPKPRTEIKRSEIPIPAPKPRPEIIQRVEPVPRPQQPPPSIPSSMDYELKVALPEEKVNGSFSKDVLRYSGSSDLPSEESSEHNDSKDQIEVLHIDLPDTDELRTESYVSETISSSQIEEKPKLEPKRGSFSKTSDLFTEDFSEPSPREIMSKLARESRIRRSLDHQRGVLGDSGETGPSKNIREPQGIPGKRFSSTNGDEDEEDTNPLRMLRGGAIPIRGGRVGQGTNSNSSSVAFPKLRVNIPALHHSMSVDSGARCVEHVNGDNALMLSNHGNECTDTPPAVPPRSYSMRVERSKNPIPLPPRKPLTRSTTLNAPPRGRKYPLLDTGFEEGVDQSQVTNEASSVAWQINHNTSPIKHERTSEPPPSPPSSPSHSPPPPLFPRAKNVQTENVTNNRNLNSISDFQKVDDDDDNVFEPEKSPVMERKSKNALSDSEQINSSALRLDLPLSNSSKSATFPRGNFRLQNIDCNLEQLGFYNGQDPFWDQNLTDGRSSEEVSPLMLANYKTEEGVSYEDLLDFALDRSKDSPEVTTLQKIFCNEVSAQDCKSALDETKGDLLLAIKYIKLKQLLSTHLADVKKCKEALLICDWDIQKAANHILSNKPPSPECVDV